MVDLLKNFYFYAVRAYSEDYTDAKMTQLLSGKLKVFRDQKLQPYVFVSSLQMNRTNSTTKALRTLYGLYSVIHSGPLLIQHRYTNNSNRQRDI